MKSKIKPWLDSSYPAVISHVTKLYQPCRPRVKYYVLTEKSFDLILTNLIFLLIMRWKFVYIFRRCIIYFQAWLTCICRIWKGYKLEFVKLTGLMRLICGNARELVWRVLIYDFISFCLSCVQSYRAGLQKF